MKKKTIVGLLCFCFINAIASAAERNADQTSTTTTPQVRPLANEDEKKPHIGLMAGIANPEGSFSATGEYGLDIGYQPYFPIGLGVLATYSVTEAGPGTRLQRTSVLGKVSYNFGGTTPVIKDSYVGFAVGPTFKPDGTNIASGPLLGFDIPLKESQKYFLSLGAVAKYVIESGSDPDTLSVNGVLKYWY